jgi:hypothetical protein
MVETRLERTSEDLEIINDLVCDNGTMDLKGLTAPNKPHFIILI